MACNSTQGQKGRDVIKFGFAELPLSAMAESCFSTGAAGWTATVAALQGDFGQRRGIFCEQVAAGFRGKVCALRSRLRQPLWLYSEAWWCFKVFQLGGTSCKARNRRKDRTVEKTWGRIGRFRKKGKKKEKKRTYSTATATAIAIVAYCNPFLLHIFLFVLLSPPFLQFDSSSFRISFSPEQEEEWVRWTCRQTCCLEKKWLEWVKGLWGGASFAVRISGFFGRLTLWGFLFCGRKPGWFHPKFVDH